MPKGARVGAEISGRGVERCGGDGGEARRRWGGGLAHVEVVELSAEELRRVRADAAQQLLELARAGEGGQVDLLELVEDSPLLGEKEAARHGALAVRSEDAVPRVVRHWHDVRRALHDELAHDRLRDGEEGGGQPELLDLRRGRGEAKGG